MVFFFFFFNDTATTEIYTLSLHDALPICISPNRHAEVDDWDDLLDLIYRVRTVTGKPVGIKTVVGAEEPIEELFETIRSEEHTSELQSPVPISYAVFCLKKKKKKESKREKERRQHTKRPWGDAAPTSIR